MRVTLSACPSPLLISVITSILSTYFYEICTLGVEGRIAGLSELQPAAEYFVWAMRRTFLPSFPAVHL